MFSKFWKKVQWICKNTAKLLSTPVKNDAKKPINVCYQNKCFGS